MDDDDEEDESDEDETGEEYEKTVDVGADDDLNEGEEQQRLQDVFGDAAVGLHDHINDDSFESPLDDVDEFVFFAMCLEQLKKRDVGFYNQWGKNLPNPKRALLTKAMNLVPTKQKELATKLENKKKSEQAKIANAQLTMQQLQKLQAEQHQHMARAHSVGNSIANTSNQAANNAGSAAAKK